MIYKCACFYKDELSSINLVLERYGSVSGSYLVDYTHVDGSPWKTVYRDGVKNIEIPKETIQKSFSHALGAIAVLTKYKEEFEKLALR